jgi:hypothetical protein
MPIQGRRGVERRLALGSQIGCLPFRHCKGDIARKLGAVTPDRGQYSTDQAMCRQQTSGGPTD